MEPLARTGTARGNACGRAFSGQHTAAASDQGDSLACAIYVTAVRLGTSNVCQAGASRAKLMACVQAQLCAVCRVHCSAGSARRATQRAPTPPDHAASLSRFGCPRAPDSSIGPSEIRGTAMSETEKRPVANQPSRQPATRQPWQTPRVITETAVDTETEFGAHTAADYTFSS
jgi:hypothetical protein